MPLNTQAPIMPSKEDIESVGIVYQHTMTTFQDMLVDVKPTDQVKWQRLYVMGLLHAATQLAVDAGMTKDQLLAVTAETYRGAYERAPKFS